MHSNSETNSRILPYGFVLFCFPYLQKIALRVPLKLMIKLLRKVSFVFQVICQKEIPIIYQTELIMLLLFFLTWKISPELKNRTHSFLISHHRASLLAVTSLFSDRIFASQPGSSTATPSTNLLNYSLLLLLRETIKA